MTCKSVITYRHQRRFSSETKFELEYVTEEVIKKVMTDNNFEIKNAE